MGETVNLSDLCLSKYQESSTIYYFLIHTDGVGNYSNIPKHRITIVSRMYLKYGIQ